MRTIPHARIALLARRLSASPAALSDDKMQMILIFEGLRASRALSARHRFSGAINGHSRPVSLAVRCNTSTGIVQMPSNAIS